MTFRPDHELHRRRMGRNFGLGAVLLIFAALVFGLTVVKARENGLPLMPNQLEPRSLQGAGQ